jgi:hypothetical protein
MTITLGDVAQYWGILLCAAAVAVGGKLLSSFIITKLRKMRPEHVHVYRLHHDSPGGILHGNL